MKISYIILKRIPSGGGIEKYTEEVGSRLVQRGHEVNVYVMNHYQTERYIYKGMKVKTVPAIKKKSLEKLSATMFAAVLSAIKDSSDIVHFHAFGPGMFCIIPKIFGKKVVVQGHGLEWKRSRWSGFGRWFLKLTEWPSVKIPPKVTVVSKVQQKYLKEKYGIESVYIPTGVNPPKIEKPDLIKKYGLEGNDYILFAARLVREKGAHHLLRAYNKVKPPLKLVIAGDAPYEEKYKEELKRLAGNNGNVIFTGFVSGKLLEELFSNCYIFVLPSEIEGLPTALLEAMSYENCCLVSDIEENLEALNGLGRSFKNGDVNSLADEIDYLIKHPEFVEEVRPKAKEYILKNYLWDSIAERLEGLYKEILNGG